MGRAGRKGQQLTFVLFTPKWTQLKRPEEIEKILTRRAVTSTKTQLPNTLVGTASKPGPLAQEVGADTSDNESMQGSEIKSIWRSLMIQSLTNSFIYSLLMLKHIFEVRRQ